MNPERRQPFRLIGLKAAFRNGRYLPAAKRAVPVISGDKNTCGGINATLFCMGDHMSLHEDKACCTRRSSLCP